jgi:UDP-3-O-[3-hydroxymyristoyl] glucosamine N-acyltransferase
MVAAGSGVHRSLAKGAKVGGVPAIPIRDWAKATAVYARLPEIYSELKKLRNAVTQLQDTQIKKHLTGEKHD